MDPLRIEFSIYPEHSEMSNIGVPNKQQNSHKKVEQPHCLNYAFGNKMVPDSQNYRVFTGKDNVKSRLGVWHHRDSIAAIGCCY